MQQLVGEGEGGQSTGGEFDGQRHPVEPVHDVGDRTQLVRRRRGTGADPAGPVEEERYGGDPSKILVGSGHREWRQP